MHLVYKFFQVIRLASTVLLEFPGTGFSKRIHETRKEKEKIETPLNSRKLKLELDDFSPAFPSDLPKFLTSVRVSNDPSLDARHCKVITT